MHYNVCVLGFCREQYTLQLLNKFKAKVSSIKTMKMGDDDGNDESTPKDDVNEEELNSDKWMVIQYIITSNCTIFEIQNYIQFK